MFTATPAWVKKHNYGYADYAALPDTLIDGLRVSLARFRHPEPVVSIVVCAWNEEVNIVKTLATLAHQRTDLRVEIVVVNNNSTDHTADVLRRLGVNTVFQPVQGWGPARQMGQEAAKGKFILTADADCLYPPTWVDAMMRVLTRPGVACVYGRYAFIPERGFPRWKLATLERLKNAIAELRQWKRPYLNVLGMNSGYVRELGLRVGFVMHKIRGEDGRLAFDLMQYGKVKPARSSAATVWTGPRALQRDGSFGKALLKRLGKEARRFGEMLRPMPAHDTKVSTNE